MVAWFAPLVEAARLVSLVLGAVVHLVGVQVWQTVLVQRPRASCENCMVRKHQVGFGHLPF